MNWLSHSLSKRSPLSSHQYSHSHSQLKTLLLFKFYWSIADLGFPSSSAGKESTCKAGVPGLIPGSGWCPGEGHGNTVHGKSPWTEEPGVLQLIGSQRVRHDWATKCNTAHSWFTICANFCYTVKWFSYSYSFSRFFNIEYSSLCYTGTYTEGPCYLSILYMIVLHLLFSNSQPFPLPPPLPFGDHKTVLRLCFLLHWQVEAVGVSGSVVDQKLQNLPPK